MKRYTILLQILMASATAAMAAPSIPDEAIIGAEAANHAIAVTDPEYEWSQTDTKKAKVEFKSQSLVLESKDDKGAAFSVVELPINVEDNAEFAFGLNLDGPKVDDSKSFGMLFDYQDMRNYKCLQIGKKQYAYIVVKDGTDSIVKTGPVKHKGSSFSLVAKRENGGIEFFLNGLQVCRLRKITLSSSYCGVCVCGKAKAELRSFMMYVPEQDDSEQATTDM
ncbi:MAG: hypothetical protein ACI30W_04030 [Muribaculaceae bacterium]